MEVYFRSRDSLNFEIFWNTSFYGTSSIQHDMHSSFLLSLETMILCQKKKLRFLVPSDDATDFLLICQQCSESPTVLIRLRIGGNGFMETSLKSLESKRDVSRRRSKLLRSFQTVNFHLPNFVHGDIRCPFSYIYTFLYRCNLATFLDS